MKLMVCLVVVLVLGCYSSTMADPGDFTLGDKLVLRFRAPLGNMTIPERVDALTEAVLPLLSPDSFDVNLLKIDESKIVTIRYDNRLLLTVDEKTASLNKLTPLQLANIWHKNLSLAIPSAQARDFEP